MQPLTVAKLAAEAGGTVVSAYYRDGVTMRSKAPHNLVSDADVESEQAIAAVIRAHFPDHAVLGEEAHQAPITASNLWVVDPLDGTNNFAHGVPQFAISIAYCRDGVIECGVVFDPIHDDWYVAQRGHGALHNDLPVHTGTQRTLDEVLIGVGFYYDRGARMTATLAAVQDLFGRNIHGIRRFGAAALDLCHVGTGRFGAFFEYELSPWDFAAGQLFVAESGGRVTTCQGDPLRLTKSSVLASNGHLHASMLEIVGTHEPTS
ncbi:MAG: inositol monophosphatase family protein [Planctomycetaceae bacterium]